MVDVRDRRIGNPGRVGGIAVVLVVATLACTAASPVEAEDREHRKGTPVGSEGIMNADKVLSLARTLCERLAKAAVPATELGRGLGSLEAEGATSVRVKPADPGLNAITVSREASSLEATYVEVMLATPATVELAALTQAFGEPTTPPRVGSHHPVRYLFRPAPTAGHAFACAILVSTEGPAGADPLRVTGVSVRRDPMP